MSNENRGRGMKEGWKKGVISDCCYVISGQSPKGSSYNTDGLGMEFHQGKKAFGTYILKNSGVWTTEVTKVAECGDILMSVRAPVGPTNITNRKICIGRGLAAIRCKYPNEPTFILYALKNIQNRIVGNDGAVFNSINKDLIEKLPIPLIDVEEQQSIVAHLDASFAEIDVLKAKAAEEVANAKAMFDAALREEMTPKEGWEVKTLKDIGDSKVGPFGSLLHKSDYIVGGIPLINPMHIVNGCIKADSNFSINKEKYNELQAFVMKDGDIVIARRGEMGRCAVVNSNQSGYLCGTGSIFYRPNKSLVNSVFLQLLISSENIKKEIVKIAGGATMLNLSSKGLNSLTISIPQIEIQQRIVDKLDTLRSHLTELEQKYNLIAANCDALKQAILRETFE